LAKHKRARCRTCGELGFVRARDPQTNIKKLFVARKDPITKELVPMFDRPHVGCKPANGGMSEQQVRVLVKQLLEEQEVASLLGEKVEIKHTDGTTEVATVPTTSSAPSKAETIAIVRQEMTRVVEQIQRDIDEVKEVEHIVVLAKPGDVRVKIEGHRHPLFARLLRYCSAGTHVYLYGAPGGGKSTAARHAADALGRQYGYLSLAPMTPESRIMGYMDAQGVFRDTMFFKCYTEGGIFCIDEMDNANDALLTALNGALENDIASFPNGVFPAHKDFVLVATGNTAGYGGTRGHAGRRAFDAATRERFAYIPWVYDEPFEEADTRGQQGSWLLDELGAQRPQVRCQPVS